MARFASGTAVSGARNAPESSSQLLQSLHFRPIQPQDRQQIQALHEQWFPVRYHDEFYDSLVYGRLTTVARSSKNRKQDSKHAKAAVGAPPSSQKRASDQHFSLARKDRRRPESHVAIESDEENNLLPECSDLERSSDAWSEDRDILVDDSPSTMPRGRALFTYLAIQRGRQGQLDDPDLSTSSGMNNNVTTALSPQPNPDQPHTTDRIVACIVGAFLEAHCLPLDLRNLLAPNPERHPLLFYIMTLGTADDYRNRGLATRLVQECIRLQVLPNPECGTLYLHVLDTNQAAIRFYENLGFHRVKLIANYYNIDGQSRDCYLYASYFHGAFPKVMFTALGTGTEKLAKLRPRHGLTICVVPVLTLSMLLVSRNVFKTYRAYFGIHASEQAIVVIYLCSCY